MTNCPTLPGAQGFTRIQDFSGLQPGQPWADWMATTRTVLGTLLSVAVDHDLIYKSIVHLVPKLSVYSDFGH